MGRTLRLVGQRRGSVSLDRVDPSSHEAEGSFRLMERGRPFVDLGEGDPSSFEAKVTLHLFKWGRPLTSSEADHAHPYFSASSSFVHLSSFDFPLVWHFHELFAVMGKINSL